MVQKNEYHEVHLDEHHRRPQSLDGKNDPGNMSYVQQPPHRTWHALFGNMNVYQICERLNKIVFNNIGKQIVPIFIKGTMVRKTGKNACKTRGKFIYHWKKFIEYCDNDIDKTIEWINNVWIDSAYFLEIQNKATTKKNNRRIKKNRYVIRFPKNRMSKRAA